MKIRLKEILIVSLITLIVLFATVEGYYRYHYASQRKNHALQLDNELGWIPKPSYHFEIKNHHVYGDISYRSDKYGFRVFGDPNTRRTKIFVIGDSFTHAVQVSNGKTFYDYLQNSNPNIEIFAYGVNGFGTLQEYMVLDKYFDVIKPDLILWQFCENDFVNNNHQLESMSERHNNLMVRPYYNRGKIETKFPLPYGQLTKHLLFIRHLLLQKKLKRMDVYSSADNLDDVQFDNELFAGALDTTDKILALVRQRVGDIPIIAFAVGGNGHFKKLSSKHNIEFIDDIDRQKMKMRFAKSSAISEPKFGKIDFMPDDPHWSAPGHRVVGEIILNYLIDNNYIKK